MDCSEPRLIVQGLFKDPVDFQQILDMMSNGVIVLDRDRRVVAVNNAFEVLTGFLREEARGVRCAHITRNSVCNHRCPALSSPDSGQKRCHTGDIISKDRVKIPVRITLSPVYSRNGEHHGYLEIIEDLRVNLSWDWERVHHERFGHLVGNSPEIQKVFHMLPLISQSDSSVLITGETGTGKDLVAEAVHRSSERARGPFVKINCGALPDALLESELFGHVRGAFTGATESKTGWARQADNGTLFLAEVGDLNYNLQTKLLSFLDDKVVYPLGCSEGVKVNVRIIAATLRNLEQMVQQNTFRSDLFFRLNVIRLNLSPLREREGDILLLLDHFLRSFSQLFRKNIDGYSDEALRILMDFRYPGNVRELRNIVEYATNVCQGNKVLPAHLPLYVREGNPAHPPETLPWGVPSVAPLNISASDKSIEMTWRDMEKKMILKALAQAKGKRAKAAEILGWGRSTLWRKIKDHGLDS
ncbi:MAG: sigma 54-interacting transcriptional regulator [Desulfomicrobium apsheronum]|nr:sigma 54-interacting transcriptional regulator [Desulfomicrobium apsheronum]